MKNLKSILNIEIVIFKILITFLLYNEFNIYISLLWLVLSLGFTNIALSKNKINIKKSEREHLRYQRAIEALNGGLWEWIEGEDVLFMSSRFRKVFNTDQNIDSFDKLCQFIDISDRNYIDSFFKDMIEGRVIDEFSLEFMTIPIYNSVLFMECTGKGEIKNNRYQLTGLLLDVTEKKKQEELLRKSEKNFRRALEGSKDIMFYINIEQDELTVDKKIGKLLEIEIEEELYLKNKEWIELILDEDKQNYEDAYANFLISESEYFLAEYRMKTNSGRLIWIREKGKRMIEEVGSYIYGSISDITDSKEKELKIYYMSHFDEVTGIPNRRSFIEKANIMLSNSIKNNKDFGVVFIDLDNFKYVNDTFGHDVGDNLLTSFCAKLNSLLNKDCLLARFGGDEFIISIGNINSKEDVLQLMEKILKGFNTPFKIGGKDIYCTVTIGVSLYSSDGGSIQDLLNKADIAMYKAKANGKNRYLLFNSEISDQLNRELDLKRCLRKAIDEKEIYFEYQPKYWIENEEIEGFECLARWTDDELGKVNPGEFIPIAESTGLVIPMGSYLIDDTFRKCKKLAEVIRKDFKLAINLSQVQIRDDKLIPFIKNKIDEYEIDPKYIEFEVTESSIMKSPEESIKVLEKIKALGISIALDDFGTGYSSLNYLKRLPIDKVKIDKSFVDDIGKDVRSQHIIEKIIELSHMLELKVIAEGVETRKQLEYLQSINCDIIQGYYYSKPQPYSYIINLVSKIAD